MIVLDVEMTGLDLEKHSILSIGALDVEDPTNRFYGECRAWEGARIEEEALAVNGFTKEQATDPSKQSEAELVQSFIDWSVQVPERTLGGQNCAFDRMFIDAACRRGGIACPFAHRVIDAHSLTWMHMIKRGLTPPEDEKHHHSAINLTFALNYCGVPAEPKPHNALTGALCHAEVISRVAYTKKLLPEFAQYEIPWLMT
jgi:DNA polymerase III epsilon subunit-like protein